MTNWLLIQINKFTTEQQLQFIIQMTNLIYIYLYIETSLAIHSAKLNFLNSLLMSISDIG